MKAEDSKTAKTLFEGAGETSALLRSIDWSQTPLGAIETWSDNVKTTAQILLSELDRAKLPETPPQESDSQPNSSSLVALNSAAQLDAFCIKLADALRPLTDATEILEVAARVLGEALAATRVIYIEVVSGEQEVTVHCNYTNGVAPLSGRYRLEDYRRNLTEDHQTGRTQIVTDIPNHPDYTVAEKARYDAIDIAAHIDVPLIKNNQFVALLAVHYATPRQWTDIEVKQVEETAERTWVAVELARAEAALRQSEAKYRTLFQSIEEGFCSAELLYDENGQPVDHRFLDANPAFETHTGLTRPQGRLASELMPGLEQIWNELYGRVIATGRSERVEEYSPAFDRWFDVEVSRIGEQSLHQVVVVFRDVTVAKHLKEGRKRAEALLQASHDTFLHLVENSPFGVYVVDADFQLAQVSAGAQKVFENIDPLIGRDFAEVLRIVWQEPFASEAIARFRHTLETGEPYHAPNTIERRYNLDAIEAYDWKIERIMLPDERFGVVCHFYDMTERQRYAAELQASEARFRNMADNAPMMIWVTNPTGYCTYLSQSWYDFTGQTEAMGLGFGWFEAVHPDDRAAAKAAFLAANNRQEAFQLEYRLYHQDGQYRTCIDAAKPWFGADGTFKGYIGSVIDIDDRIQAEAALRQREQRLTIATEAAQLGIFEWRVPEDITVWENDRMYELFGLQPTDPSISAGEFFEQYLHPEDAEAFTNIMTQAMQTGSLRQATYRIRRRDGTLRWIEVNG